MAYANQFVASIVLNNQIQREFKKDGNRTVQLPFDSEYKIKVQNKNSFKALVDVQIDGVSIFSSGKQLQLAPYQSVDLERFVNDMSEGSRFKFVSFANAVKEGHQDPTAKEFGLITITFTPQKVPSLFDSFPTLQHDGYMLGGRGINTKTLLRSNSLGAATNSSLYCNANISSSLSDAQVTYSSAESGLLSNNVGVESVKGGTVEGSKSEQKFSESTDVVIWDYANTTTIKTLLVGESKETGPFPKEVSLDNKKVLFQWMNKNPDGSITVCYK